MKQQKKKTKSNDLLIKWRQSPVYPLICLRLAIVFQVYYVTGKTSSSMDPFHMEALEMREQYTRRTMKGCLSVECQPVAVDSTLAQHRE